MSAKWSLPVKSKQYTFLNISYCISFYPLPRPESEFTATCVSMNFLISALFYCMLLVFNSDNSVVCLLLMQQCSVCVCACARARACVCVCVHACTVCVHVCLRVFRHLFLHQTCAGFTTNIPPQLTRTLNHWAGTLVICWSSSALQNLTIISSWLPQVLAWTSHPPCFQLRQTAHVHHPCEKTDGT